MAFENSNREYTLNALSYKANNRQGETFLFSAVKLYARTESEVAELAGQTNNPPSTTGTMPFSYSSRRIQQFSVY